MTAELADRYNINMNIININTDSINLEQMDINTLGHGRTRIKENI